MPFYKDTSNRVHFIDSVDDEVVLPAGCVPITAIEAGTLTAPPPLAAAQVRAICDAALDQYVDSVAEARGYRRVGITPSNSCIGYAAFPNTYQAEAVAFGEWMAACWPIAYTFQADVEGQVAAGTRAAPVTEADAVALAAELIALIEKTHPMVWP